MGKSAHYTTTTEHSTRGTLDNKTNGKATDNKRETFTIPEKELVSKDVSKTSDVNILKILEKAPHDIPERHKDDILLKNVITSFSLILSDSLAVFLVAKLFSLKLSVVPTFVVVSLVYKLYSRRFPFWDEVGKITGASFFSSLIYTIQTGEFVSGFIFFWIAPVAVSVVRSGVKELLWILGVSERVLVVGGGQAGIKVLKAIDSERYLGYDVVGVLDDDKSKLYKPVWRIRGRDVLVIGQTTDIWNILKETQVDEVILAIPSLGDKLLTALASHLQKFVPKVSVVPDMFGLPVLAELKSSFGQQVLFLTVQNKLANPLNRLAKELMDKTLALIIFVLVGPLLLLLAIIIKLDSPGSAIFSHERIGKGGKKFKCLKFRTMYVNNEEILKKYLEQNPEAYRVYVETGKIPEKDPRITRVGRILRKLSLDELPQIINVLKGDMSLVGPRALVPSEVDRCAEYYMEWAKYIKPGITGLAQIMGRANISHEDKNIISLWYMKNWSIWLDFVIILKTIVIVLKMEGAY